ncbi:testis-specific expressed protein 55 [Marmota flaviventris]|uniref:testis-specific expressed protein 55 n=1 Tax=Marmota flaviventris TaxID=93162 RepID=UPI003A86FE9B
MDAPEEEDPGESLEEESPATPPTAGHTDNQEEDNQENQDQEKAYEQTHYRIADQNGQRVSGAPEPFMSDQSNQKDSEHLENSSYDQADLQSSEQTDDKAYDQVENVAAGETDGQVPGLIEEGTSEQTERSSSRQEEKRASEQADRAEGRASIQTDHRMSSQTEERTYEQTGDRLSIPFDPRTSKQEDSLAEKTSEKVDQVDYVKTLYNIDHQATEGAEQQTFDQADQLKVGKDDYSRPDQAEYLIHKEAYPKDYQYSYGSEYGLLPQFRDDKEAQDRPQPCTFEDSEIYLKSALSSEIEKGGISPTQSHYPIDTRFTGHFPTKDQSFYQRLPSISTKSDDVTQEKYESAEFSPDDYSESEQEKSSHMPKQGIYKKRLPPVVYEDPYQVSLQYMEKHQILQIFQQITENLVYEKPEDPLSFMLFQDLHCIPALDLGIPLALLTHLGTGAIAYILVLDFWWVNGCSHHREHQKSRAGMASRTFHDDGNAVGNSY